ncbi:DUF3955 domain-containing protein [Ruegeria atlantica]|uniref:DUF3955 domain-containing protein n=1 Tax=Ruegeria atlantica TaxID=81569 RepID=A0A0P1ECL0_9RHOB|nr:DUF3955 domain-containing protein [Ruegeria atlantica]CUH46711.1 hypothetical protein RUA4292_00877 [Ruegeria atlantica]
MTRLRLFGIVSLFFAALSGLSEHLFYGGVGPNGVLHESFFLPLTFILAAIGVVVIVASLFQSRRD